MLCLTISCNSFVLWWTCTPWLGAMLEHDNWILACDQMASDSELTLYYIKWITRYAENTLSYHTWMEVLKFQTDQRRVLKEETSGTLSWNYYNRNVLMPGMRKHSFVTCQSVPLNHPCHPSSSHNCLSCQQHFSVNTGSQSKMIGFFSAYAASPCRFFFSRLIPVISP